MKIDDIQVKFYSSKQPLKLPFLEPNGTNDEWNWKIKNRFCCVSRFENDFFNSLQSRYHNQGSKDCLFKGLNLVTYRFVDFNVGGAFDKSYFTAPFRGIYAFSAQIGTKKRVNTYIFMKVIPLFSYPLTSGFFHQDVMDEDDIGKFELTW